MDQLIYIFECRLSLRDENSSLKLKTLTGTSLIDRLSRVQGDFKKFFKSKGKPNRLVFVLYVFLPRQANYLD